MPEAMTFASSIMTEWGCFHGGIGLALTELDEDTIVLFIKVRCVE